MDHGKKDILLHLYGEASEASALHSLLRDEELRQEHAALSEAKFRLDHLKRERPDAAVIDRILAEAAAGQGLPSSTNRKDRPAVARSTRLRKVMLPVLTLAAAIIFGVAVGWFGSQSATVTPEEPAVATAPDDIVPPESLYRFVPPQPVTPASTQDPRLAWDDSAPLMDMHRRIESMRPEGMLDWGEQAVPLESLPGSGARSIQLTGSNKN